VSTLMIRNSAIISQLYSRCMLYGNVATVEHIESTYTGEFVAENTRRAQYMFYPYSISQADIVTALADITAYLPRGVLECCKKYML
jgi:hypothetical protein